MIFITKTTQILKILYPDNVPVECVNHVSTTVIPMVGSLVDMVMQDEPVRIIPDTPKPVTVLEKFNVPHEVKVIPNKKVDYPVFKETEKHDITSEWKETTFGGKSKHTRNNGDIAIIAPSCRVDTTWDYLKEYFDSLPDETVINDLPGLGIIKYRTITNFYSYHPGFHCHIEMKNKFNVLIKDEVIINQDTNVDLDG